MKNGMLSPSPTPLRKALRSSVWIDDWVGGVEISCPFQPPSG
jgi:hypothetical protein